MAGRVRPPPAGCGASGRLTYPGGVFGPHDPHDGESSEILRGILHRTFTFLPDAGLPICDVRDIAAMHTAIMEKGRGPRRYMAGGHYTSLRDLVAHVARAARRRLPTFPAPVVVAVPVGRLGDWLRTNGVHTGLSSEGAWLSSRRARADVGPTERDLGVSFRAVATSVHDQIRWMEQTGRL